MSTVRSFNSIPHIVRYGMHDEKEGKSGTLFYRNGVCFRVSVSHEDVSGTPFSVPWLELIKEGDVRDGAKSWIRQWEMLCDCVITPCLPLLETLAPSSHHWATLHDYLHTPTYELKLVTDEKTADVVPKITSGPIDCPSYEHHPMTFSDIGWLPENVSRYHAESLSVMGRENDWRRPPHKVRVPSGEIFYFRPCNKPAQHVETGVISNPSLCIINAYSRLHSYTRRTLPFATIEEVHIPRLQGVVVSRANAGPDKTNTSSTAGEGQIEQREPEILCAGILLNYVPHAKTLADLMKLSKSQIPATDLSKYKEKWKEQIASAIRYLHDHRITIGGRSGPNAWYFINQYTIYISKIDGGADSGMVSEAVLEAADAWLMLDADCRVHPPEEGLAIHDEKFAEQREMDWLALEKVFEFWLHDEEVFG